MDYKGIVQKVLQMRPVIHCKRHEIVKTPSIMLAEFDHELARSTDLEQKIKKNVQQENIVQKERFQRMKEKYDREGVEFVEDEVEIAEKGPQMRGRG
jgi:hypothetical protein